MCAARVACQSGVPRLFQGMSFWMGCGYKGSGLSPQQLAELLMHGGGRVLHHLPDRLAGKHPSPCTQVRNILSDAMLQ